jgi:hypothetical protein
MNRAIMYNEVGWALNRLREHPPTSLIDHSDPEMVHRFTEVASLYLRHGIQSKSVEERFDQEIRSQVGTVKYVDHPFTAALLMRAATEGLNAALRVTIVKVTPKTLQMKRGSLTKRQSDSTVKENNGCAHQVRHSTCKCFLGY